MLTKRNKIWTLFSSQPHEAFSVKDLTELTGLSKTQVRRVVQHFKERGLLISAKDKYSGIGRKGKIVYYTLSHEVYQKLRSRT